MVQEAEEHAAEDKEKRALVEAKNQGEALVHQTQQTLDELGEKVPAADRKAVDDGLSALREALKGDDKAAIESRMQSLAQLSMKLGEQLYKEQQGAGGDAGAGPQGEDQQGGQAGDDKVVDADFEEVDDDKKKQ
jgi:molecular chaperone DnaK